MSAAHEERPEVGSLAEEATALFGALAGAMAGWTSSDAHPNDRAQDPGTEPRRADSQQAGAAAADSAVGAEGAEPHDCTCTRCPVCRGLALLHQVSPEVRGHLMDAGTSLLAAVTSLLATAVPRDRAPGARPPEPGPRVSRIPVDDEG